MQVYNIKLIKITKNILRNKYSKTTLVQFRIEALIGIITTYQSI